MRRAARVLLAAGALALVLTAPASAFLLTEFEGFTPYDQGGGRLDGIVLGADGNLWVAEFSAGKIAKVSLSGAVLQEITLHQGAKPTGVATGPNGTVWATLVGTHELARIEVANPDPPQYVDTGAGVCGPVGIVEGPGQRMYFTLPTDDSTETFCDQTARIGRVDADGGNLTTQTSGWAFDIASAAGRLFIADDDTEAIRRLDPETLQAEATSASVGGFPVALTPGPDGNIWFVQFAEAGKVGRIAPGFANDAQAELFTPSSELKYAAGIAAGPEGAVYVAARDSSRLARVRMDGTFSFYDIPNARNPFRLVQGRDDDLWYTDTYGNRVAHFISTRPRVATGAGSAAAATVASLAATVDPRGSATSVRFEYGPSTAYGTSTPPQQLASGVGENAVSAQVTNLAPSTTYHFRVVASNAEGETAGADGTFTTPAGFIDADGDGSSPPSDCDDTNPAIHPGARDIPGDGINQDCSDGDAPYPLLAASATFTSEVKRTGTRLLRLRVIDLAGGETITVACKGRGCPKRKRDRTRRVTARKAGKLSVLSKPLGRALLRPKSTVTVTITKGGYVGKVYTATVRRRPRGPKIVRRCLPPGASKTIACPSG